jgi:hypothetical protein
MSAEKNTDVELPEELKSIETALRQLTPLGSQLNRDRLMYMAGQASAGQALSPASTTGRPWWKAAANRNLWPLATAALALVCITLGGLLISQRSDMRLVYVERTPTESENSSVVTAGDAARPYAFGISPVANNSNYLELRNLVLTRGVDALPTTPAAKGADQSPLPLPILPLLRRQLLGGES